MILSILDEGFLVFGSLGGSVSFLAFLVDIAAASDDWETVIESCFDALSVVAPASDFLDFLARGLETPFF